MNVKLPLANAATLAGIAAAAVLAAGSADAAGNAYGRQGAVYDYARVLSAEPNVRYVTVTAPVQECWEETRYYTVRNRPAGGFAGTLMGAVIGGVVGHQFGSGRGNDAATVAGSLIGAAIGNDAASRRQGVEETTESARPIRRCETKYTSHQEERVDSYRVIYEYHGQKYATDTPYDPGDRIRIRVDVRPAP
jgi:uncharacterized protein YcfJ